jgi:hypothetical protein
MSTVSIKSAFLASVYRNLYAQHVEAQRLGLEQSQRTWPSGAGSASSARAGTSPLGGVAKPAAESEGL